MVTPYAQIEANLNAAGLVAEVIKPLVAYVATPGYKTLFLNIAALIFPERDAA